MTYDPIEVVGGQGIKRVIFRVVCNPIEIGLIGFCPFLGISQ
jgi:hypothetical protein